MMKLILKELFENKTLSQKQAYEVLKNIAINQFNEAQMTAFMTVFMMRKISLQELLGFRTALMELALKVDLKTDNLIDIVGTGGDEKNTFNISTLSCFVAAACGVKVAKHGNYSASSISGASNVMEYFGYQFSNQHQKLQSEIDTIGLTFCHAPLFHPALKSVANVRKNLKIRTFFNLLGPLVNPCQPQINIIGVYNLEVLRLYTYALQNLKKQFVLIHSLDGYDEISLTSDAKIVTPNNEQLYSVNEMTDLKIKEQDIDGGTTVEDAAKIFINILKNEAQPAQKEVVLINTAFALMGAHKANNIVDAKKIANEAIESGKAYEVFQRLMNIQQK